MRVNDEVMWTVTESSGKVSVTAPKKMAYVPPWKSVPEEQREKLFNAMRGALSLAELMETK